MEEKDIKRNDIDNQYKRNTGKKSYKNRKFNGKRTVKDEYSGETLYYSFKGQNNKKNIRHYTTKKTANVDHIKPIDKILQQYEKDIQSGKLTVEQVKEIANSDYNLAITSEARNKSKGGKSNIEYLISQLKEGNPENFNTSFTMIQKELGSNAATSTAAQANKINNKVSKITKKSPEAGNQFIGNTASAVGKGTETAFMAATISTVNNFVLVATGDKSVKDAAKDISLDVGGSFVSGASLDLLQSLAKEQAKKHNNEFIKNVLSKDLPIQEITTAISIGNSVIRYINDDISAEECATEIILNGLGSIAYTMGMTMGGPAGAIIATVVMGQISRVVIEYQNTNKLTEEKNKKAEKLKNIALEEMKNQRLCFRNAVKKEFDFWDKNIEDGFNQILCSACSETYSFEGISDGIDKILSVFGKYVYVNNLDEYKKQLPNSIII